MKDHVDNEDRRKAIQVIIAETMRKIKGNPMMRKGLVEGLRENKLPWESIQFKPRTDNEYRHAKGDPVAI